ncbi:MAG: peptide chain release factor 1 [Pseudomonadota bacterium]
MFENLTDIEARYERLEAELAKPEIVKDQKFYQKTTRQHSELSKVVTVYRRYLRLNEDLRGVQEMVLDSDEEIKNLARAEIEVLKTQIEEAQVELKILLIPKDPNDEKNVVLEIRAGTGGEEASLFAADLFRMYARFAEKKNWKIDILSSHPTGSGGFKEIIILIEGDGVYSRLKRESGVHRVQRVPATESQGRIHTSAVTVAVLPEAEEVDIDIKPEELKYDVYRSSGPGGQSVNTTDSAVRVTHLPSGLVVTCQDEKSQHKNKAKALKVLRARLLDLKKEEQAEQITEERRGMVGSGDRSERVRTYNFPQGRLTDHRIGLTLYRLESIMQGDIEEIIDALGAYYQTEALRNI